MALGYAVIFLVPAALRRDKVLNDIRVHYQDTFTCIRCTHWLRPPSPSLG